MTAGRKPIKDKSTEKTERVVAYLTKEQMERVNRYAHEKLGQTEVDSSTIRIAMMQYMDLLGIKAPSQDANP
jgi:hypothetical protein